MANIPFRIEMMKSDSEIELTIEMFTAYARSLRIDLGFQDFEAELASFPAKYGPPTGELCLPSISAPIGCTSRGLRHIPAASARKTYFALPTLVHKKKY